VDAAARNLARGISDLLTVYIGLKRLRESVAHGRVGNVSAAVEAGRRLLAQQKPQAAPGGPQPAVGGPAVTSTPPDASAAPAPDGVRQEGAAR
jgi:hypothetical protein